MAVTKAQHAHPVIHRLQPRRLHRHAGARPGLAWLLQFGEEAGGYDDFIAGVGALAMGAHTYEWLLRHQVQPAQGDAKPWPYAQPAWVFTTRQLPGVPGADIRFVSGDVAPAHADMVRAAAGKNVWIVGGGGLGRISLERALGLIPVAHGKSNAQYEYRRRKSLRYRRIQDFRADTSGDAFTGFPHRGKPGLENRCSLKAGAIRQDCFMKRKHGLAQSSGLAGVGSTRVRRPLGAWGLHGDAALKNDGWTPPAAEPACRRDGAGSALPCPAGKAGSGVVQTFSL